MSKPLFDNVGKEIKEIAEVIARRIMIRYFLIALIVAIGGIAGGVEGDWPIVAIMSVIIAIIIAVYGYNKSCLEVMLLYAQGELVDRIISIDNKLGKKGKNGHIPVPVKEKPDVNGKGIPQTNREKDGSWTCLFCDHKNPAGADWCEECGVQAEF